MDGHLVVKEALEILSTARIEGTITAPRISLKEGARFTGTIDMDPAAAALKTPFEGKEDSVTPSPNAQDADEARISAKPVERRKHRKTRKT
jgi:cytoskeletal protein CcmA (bactofilin family)